MQPCGQKQVILQFPVLCKMEITSILGENPVVKLAHCINNANCVLTLNVLTHIL